MKNIESKAVDLWKKYVASNNFWANYELLMEQAKAVQVRYVKDHEPVPEKEEITLAKALANYLETLAEQYWQNNSLLTYSEEVPRKQTMLWGLLTGAVFSALMALWWLLPGLILVVVFVLLMRAYIFSEKRIGKVKTYHTLDFRSNHVIYSKKATANNWNQELLYLKVPYDNIQTVIIREGNIIIKSNKSEPWYDNQQRKYNQVLIPEGMPHFSSVYAFFKDVIIFNKQYKGVIF